MIITKRRTDLKKGTTIYRRGGFIVLSSDYDKFHDRYEYKNVEVDEIGKGVICETGGHVTPSDLIGDEIY